MDINMDEREEYRKEVREIQKQFEDLSIDELITLFKITKTFDTLLAISNEIVTYFQEMQLVRGFTDESFTVIGKALFMQTQETLWEIN